MLRRSVSLALATLLCLSIAGPVAADDAANMITIDRFGGFTTGSTPGVAVITGTVVCAPGTSLESFTVFVTQKIKGHLVEGDGDIFEGLVCDGTEHHWTGGALSREVDDRGNFVYKAGPASVTAALLPVGVAERTVILQPLHE